MGGLSWEPDLTESIKWNALCFSARKLVCGISARKAHVGITFFRGTELPDNAGLFDGGEMNTLIRNVRLRRSAGGEVFSRRHTAIPGVVHAVGAEAHFRCGSVERRR